MATNHGKYLRGALGPVVYKRYRNKQVVTIKRGRGTVKQTANSQRSSSTFGLSSKLGGKLRYILDNDISGLQDGEMANRMTTIFNLMLSDCRDPKTRVFSFKEYSFRRLADFEFNINSPLRNYLEIKPETTIANGKMQVVFPVLENPPRLKFPEESSSCRMTVSLALFRLKEGKHISTSQSQRIVFDREKPELGGQTFTFEVPDGCLCVVSMFLDYRTYSVPLNHKKFSPAAVLDAFVTPGVYKANDRRNWMYMDTEF
ncbi:hypothetical protein [Pedobacter cryoconitis]|uniref:Uncharacterized protein n=1 Tax=Pedobacter cryoconitis TaxID=188932 RepID=A0A7X0MKQ6_9SPHI|nr:hypothetical protein [Pedobacter cryoconitis]MBB6500703.1 hypothetical protein [Pedobacter cryoconitis]